jgi:hypothetical protein
MINIPGETREDLNATIRMIKELPLSKCSTQAIATPYYGTKWWDLAVKQGIVPPNPSDDFWSVYNMKTLEK